MDIELKKNESDVYEIGQTEQAEDTADMEQVGGTLTGLAKTEIAGIPIGGALVGGTTAFVIDALTSRFLPQVQGSVANLAGAFLLVYVGKRFLGASAAKYGAMFLTYEAVRDWIEGALSPLVGGFSQPGGGTFEQKPAVTSNYYANALRR